MFSVDNYVASIKSNLEKQSDLLVANLKKILSYNFSSDIDLLDFSAFIEPTRFELSIICSRWIKKVTKSSMKEMIQWYLQAV
ncbi:hypothetical protein [Bacillus sp. JJ722]|uniref:hypothetical protein n=1 Tax=Bacillus sp. JJ722 TaxID=3122973 RepID=UPI002FFE67F5